MAESSDTQVTGEERNVRLKKVRRKISVSTEKILDEKFRLKEGNVKTDPEVNRREFLVEWWIIR